VLWYYRADTSYDIGPGEEIKAFARLDRGARYPVISAMSGYSQGHRADARVVCNVLSRIGNLDSLHLKLDRLGFDAQRFPRVLESFALLRNIRRVILDRVLPIYRKYLRGKMTRCSPLNYLPKIYEVLEFYIGPFDYYEDIL
jgi:hypothetical protein